AYHEPWFVKHADDYGPEMRNLVEAGLRLSATAYVSANRARLAFRDDVMSLLAAHDALLCPTAPAPAPAGPGPTGDGSLCATVSPPAATCTPRARSWRPASSTCTRTPTGASGKTAAPSRR